MEIKHLIKDRINGCPWGHKCNDCNFYKALYSSDEKGAITQEWDCQINNLVTLSGELKNSTKGVQAAVESFRNNVASTQKRITESGVQRKQIPVSVS